MDKENTKHTPIIIKKPKNEQFREKIKEMSHLITKLKREKSKNFQEAIKKKQKIMETISLVIY